MTCKDCAHYEVCEDWAYRTNCNYYHYGHFCEYFMMKYDQLGEKNINVLAQDCGTKKMNV